MPQSQARSLSFLLLLPLLLLAQPSFVAAAADLPASAGLCQRLDEMLSRLSRLVDFYAFDVDRVNADGYFAMRLSRDLLAPHSVAATAARRCGISAGRRLESTVVRQSLLTDRFVETLGSDGGYDVATFASICQPLAVRFHRLTGAPRSSLMSDNIRDRAPVLSWPRGDAALAETVTRLIEYDEPRGDACLAAALRNDGVCQQSSNCAYFDRKLDDSSGYFLTHQLLYKLIKELSPCPSAPHLMPVGKPSAGSAQLTKICRKIFAEFRLIQTANWSRVAGRLGDDAVTGLRDLYMEQGLLCGLAGAKDFYLDESVATVNSWQDPQLGCFKLYDGASAGERSGKLTMRRRKILRDAEMLGGCSAHATGIAMAFYSNSIRYLLAV